MDTLALWKSHYSLGRSILTLEKAGSSPDKNGPDSIVDIALENKLNKICLVEDSISGYLEGYQNFKAANIQMIFGLRLSFTSNAEDKSEESQSREHKMVIFAKNYEGYKRLIRISSKAATDLFYYIPRMDFKILKQYWNDADLKLCVPFYDSFLAQNALTFSSCVPDFGYTTPEFFMEDNCLPIDNIIQKRVLEYAKDKYKVIKAKSIYYRNRSDYKAYATFRAIANRGTLNNTGLDHFSSDEFCWESYLEMNKKHNG